MESTIFALLSTLPQGRMLSAFFLFAVFFSFATLADAITGTMAVLSTKNASVGEEPPVLIKALWGIVIAMISYVLIISGGQDAIRSLFTLIGLPMAFVVMGRLTVLNAGVQAVKPNAGALCETINPRQCLSSTDHAVPSTFNSSTAAGSKHRPVRSSIPTQ